MIQFYFQRGQQFVGIKPNQAVGLMKGSAIESTNLRKTVLKQKSGQGVGSNHPDASQRSSRARRKS